jgi:uncharacterized protein (UPF0210 family)
MTKIPTLNFPGFKLSGASHWLFALCLALLAAVTCAHAPATPVPDEHAKPVIRAITIFTDIDPARLDATFQDAVGMLRTAKTSFEQAGYTVQTTRITTQPFPSLVRGMKREQAIEFFNRYAVLLEKEGIISAIGPAFVHDVDHDWVEIFARVLAAHPQLDGCILVTDESGIQWPAVHEAAFVMKYLEEHTPNGQGNFGFAAAAMVPENSPFFPASYDLSPKKRFAVAVQGAGFVDEAFSGAKGNLKDAREKLEDILRRDLPGIQRVAAEVERKTGASYLGVDASTAPLRDVSIGAAIEKLTGAPMGAPGTMTAASIITGALKSDQDSSVKRVGYNGLMLPVLEDKGLAKRWSEGNLTLDSLLAYSAVCGTGIDTAPLPGDTTEEQLASIIGDVASLAVKWHKPLTARLFPVPGKKAGDRTEFDSPYLVNATIQKLR